MHGRDGGLLVLKSTCNSAAMWHVRRKVRREIGMSMTDCPNSGIGVMATSEGLCPSCGRNLPGFHSDGRAAASLTNENTETEPGNCYSQPTHFDLIWMLYSLRGRLSLGMMGVVTPLSTGAWMGLSLWARWKPAVIAGRTPLASTRTPGP